MKARVSGDGDRQLNVAGVEALVETCPAVLDELERDARHGAPPAGEEACQALQHLRGRAETKHAGISGPEGPRLLGERLGVRQELASPDDELLPLAGEADAPADAVEERHAERALERAHLPPERGLGYAQARGRRGEAARFGDGNEGAYMPQLHRCSPGIEFSSDNALDTTPAAA